MRRLPAICCMPPAGGTITPRRAPCPWISGRLGGHLTGAGASRVAACEQRRRARPAPLGHRAPHHDGSALRRRVAHLHPARQRHRNLSATRARTLDLSGRRHRRPRCRSHGSFSAGSGSGSLNGYIVPNLEEPTDNDAEVIRHDQSDV
jgi:hypothetical protein